MIVSTITRVLTRTIINYYVIGHVQILHDDSYCRLNEQMIVNDCFSVNSFAKNRLKPI